MRVRFSRPYLLLFLLSTAVLVLKQHNGQITEFDVTAWAILLFLALAKSRSVHGVGVLFPLSLALPVAIYAWWTGDLVKALTLCYTALFLADTVKAIVGAYLLRRFDVAVIGGAGLRDALLIIPLVSVFWFFVLG